MTIGHGKAPAGKVILVAPQTNNLHHSKRVLYRLVDRHVEPSFPDDQEKQWVSQDTQSFRSPRYGNETVVIRTQARQEVVYRGKKEESRISHSFKESERKQIEETEQKHPPRIRRKFSSVWARFSDLREFNLGSSPNTLLRFERRRAFSLSQLHFCGQRRTR